MVKMGLNPADFQEKSLTVPDDVAGQTTLHATLKGHGALEAVADAFRPVLQ